MSQAMRGEVDPAEYTLGPADVAEANRVGREQLEDRHRIGARPFAQGPCLVPADRARRGEPDKRHPAHDVQKCGRAWRAKAHAVAATTGHRRIQSAMIEAPVDFVENLGECRRGEPGKHPPAGRKAPVRADQMFAPRAHVG